MVVVLRKFRGTVKRDLELLYAIIKGAGEADFCEHELHLRGWTD